MSTTAADLDYDWNDVLQRSPGLKAIKVKTSTPSPSPPPFLRADLIPAHRKNARARSRSPSSRPKGVRGRPTYYRLAHQPNLVEQALIRNLGGDQYPDIVRRAQFAHLEESSPENSDCDSPMGDNVPRIEPGATSTPTPLSKSEAAVLAKQAISYGADESSSTVPASSSLSHARNPSTSLENASLARGEPDGMHIDTSVDRRPSISQVAIRQTKSDSTASSTSNAAAAATKATAAAQQAASNALLTPSSEKFKTPISVYPESEVTSPLAEHFIAESEAPSEQKLPALKNPRSPKQDNPVGSPGVVSDGKGTSLPGISNIQKIAVLAQNENEAQARQQQANGAQAGSGTGSFPHRTSISAGSVMTSPTLVNRQFANATQRSPPGAQQFPGPSGPLGLTSPISAASGGETPQSAFPKGQFSPGGANGFASAGSTPVDPSHRIGNVVGGTGPPILPIPHVSIQHVLPHGTGAFKCDFPGCTAPPFHTQYLLNSHANVHSQSRPHYCPVPGCPRAEGGKGFKRKNEMIRHGLVHDSPGYVCPFCPEREHKYPRPDNLQRHVRVHHVDKNKDDPALRDVLAQRPEGGSRGRRRRING